MAAHNRSDNQEFQCLECPKSFRQKAGLSKHLKWHMDNGQKPFMCTMCNKLFTQKAHLVKHLNVHAGEIFECSQCHKSFRKIECLIKHKKFHTKNKPYWYECVECHKRFKIKANFVEHKQIHTRETPFQCSKCYEFFTEKVDLIEHMKGHTGKKPFQCADCKFFFTQKGILLRHLRIHHVSRPKPIRQSKLNPTDDSPEYCDPSSLCQVIITCPQPDCHLTLADAGKVMNERSDDGERKDSIDELASQYFQPNLKMMINCDIVKKEPVDDSAIICKSDFDTQSQ